MIPDRWREELVSDIVLRHVASLAIDTVITFDRYGISGHKNHIALYYAMACLAMEVRCIPASTKISTSIIGIMFDFKFQDHILS